MLNRFPVTIFLRYLNKNSCGRPNMENREDREAMCTPVFIALWHSGLYWLVNTVFFTILYRFFCDRWWVFSIFKKVDKYYSIRIPRKCTRLLHFLHFWVGLSGHVYTVDWTLEFFLLRILGFLYIYQLSWSSLLYGQSK